KLEMFTIDTNFGVGIIRNGEQKLFNSSENIFDYNIFKKNLRMALNLISKNDYYNWLKKSSY
ncbi:MAG: hypothetical protein VXX85_06775, partial [Candidatus Margulisiibacteriota bacterium]|nr:hypothetical protein [Candidatus Margulisiibacteriota bacterium]